MTYWLTGCKPSEEQSDQPGKAITVTFDLLSGYDYEKDQVPELIKALNGQKVAVTGFMLPTDFEKSTVKNFLLLRDQTGCCFGMTPRMNEFVYVEMRSGMGTKYMPDVPVTVLGKFEVGEKFLVNSVYRMEADNVVVLDGF